jgi:hypothetical protein
MPPSGRKFLFCAYVIALKNTKAMVSSNFLNTPLSKLEEARCSKNAKNRGAQFKAKKYPKAIYWSEFATFLPCSSS